MATNKETREVEIIVQGQQANASLKEMGAAAAIMNNQLAKMAQDDPGRKKLQDDFARLSARLSETRAEQRKVILTEEELRAAAEKLNRENTQVILNGQKVSASFNEMERSAKLLEAELKDLSADDPGRKKLLHDYQQLQERIAGVKKEMGDVPKEGFGLGDMFAFAGVNVGLEQAVDLVKEFAGEIAETVQEFEQLRTSVHFLTGATGQELDQLTAQVAATAKTFGQENDEVLQASNALAKQMGISSAEALELIKKGFLAGADANGEFLDQVKEYPAQFKAAGLSADQFIGVITQSATTGVFSDKGADVIKEFGLRIREQTKSTSDAMEAAFGTSFTQKIFKGINDGSLTTTQALQQVSQQINDTKIPAAQLQTVIADVFGGPGEDAGLDYIKSLQNVGQSVDDMIDKTDVYTQRELALYASNEQLAASQNALAKEFEGGSTTLQTLGNEGMTLVYTLLTSLIVTFKELWQPVSDIWDALTELGVSLGLVSDKGLGAKDVGEALGDVLHLLLTPTRLLWSGLADLVRGVVDWTKKNETAMFVLQQLTAPLRLLFGLLTDGPAYFAGFSAAAETSFGTIGRAWQRLKNGDFAGIKAEFANLGRDAGAAFDRAFNEAMAKKPTAAPAPTAPGSPEAGPTGAAGGDGTTAEQRKKAADAAEKEAEKARKEREAKQKAADQQALDGVKQWVADYGQLLQGRNALENQLGDRQLSDNERRRQQERAKVFADADARVAKLTGKEADYTEQVAAIVAERDLRLRELWDKHAAEEEQRRQKEIDEKIAQSEADKQLALEELESKLANGALNEQAFQDAVFGVQEAAADRRLALLREKLGEESVEYKKALADKIAQDTTYTNRKKKLDDDLAKFEKVVSAVKKVISSDEVAHLEQTFGKRNAIYLAAKALQKSLAIADIGMGLVKQFAANRETGIQIGKFLAPVLGPAAPAVGVAYTLAANAISAAGAASNTAKILGFRKGGRTSAGGGGILDAAGLQVNGAGKLVDGEGFPVAGVVHDNEYVIPEWMRADPEVVQVEQWLETRRLRGYAQGGATTEGGSQAAGPLAEAAGTNQVVQLLTELVQEQRRHNEEMTTWVRELQVVNNLYEFDREYDTYKKVNHQSGIRG